MEQNELFLKRQFGKALRPSVLSVLGNTVNILVDGIIVGQYIGNDGLAAISLCVPVYLALCVIGSFIVSGTAICASEALGAGRSDDAGRLYTAAVIGCALISAAIAAPGWIFRDSISVRLGGTGSLKELVSVYTGITLSGAGAQIMSYIPFWFLRLDGRSQASSAVMLTMAAGNIVLDIVFISVFGMGIAGAAAASVISSLMCCILGFVLLHQKKSSFHLVPRLITDRGQLIAIAKAGTPSANNNLMDTVRLLFINFLLIRWGSNELLAVFTAVNCINAFSLAVTFGTPAAASSMQGVSFGENDNGSIRLLVRLEIKYGLLYSLGFSAVFLAFSGHITDVYGLNASLLPAIVCICLSMPFALINSILINWYNISGFNFLANLLIFLRMLVFPVAALFVLLLLGLSPWVFLVLGEAFTLLVWLFVTKPLADKGARSRFLLLDDRLEDEGRVISFSVKATAEDICEASQRITEYCDGNGMTAKQVMSISLAIEELMMVISDSDCEVVSYDVRAFSLPNGDTGIRIRYGGRPFDPFAENGGGHDGVFDAFTGVRLIRSIAKKVNYQWVFGTNSLQIFV